MLAARGYSREEAQQINSQLSDVGNTNYRVASSMVTFEKSDQIKQTERKAAPALKGIFKDHLLAAIQKQREKEEADMAEARKQEQDENSQEEFEPEADEPLEGKKE